MMADTTVRTPPKPMPGFIAVIKIDIPGEEPDNELVTEASKIDLGPGLILNVEHLFAPEPGMDVGLVMSTGPLPDAFLSEAETYIPYEAGCTVYYPSQHGITIGEFVYVPFQRIIAWEEALS